MDIAAPSVADSYYKLMKVGQLQASMPGPYQTCQGCSDGSTCGSEISLSPWLRWIATFEQTKMHWSPFNLRNVKQWMHVCPISHTPAICHWQAECLGLVLEDSPTPKINSNVLSKNNQMQNIGRRHPRACINPNPTKKHSSEQETTFADPP